jgi:phosphoglycolate phosphatase-like HAD superfamily hydrolase
MSETDWDAIRCVVFDFDGTLVDSNAIKRDTYFEILEAVPGSAEAIERVLGEQPGADRRGVLAAVHAAIGDAPDLPTVEDLVARYARLCEARVSTCAPVPGAVEALSELHSRHALYVASATPTDSLERVVELRGWRWLFRGVLGGPSSKPDNLRRIAAREGLGASQIVYVGDRPADAESAGLFGCRFAGFGAPAKELRESPKLAPLQPLVAEIAAR